MVVLAQGAAGNSIGTPVACEAVAACLRQCTLRAGTQRCIKNWIPTRHVVPVQTGIQGYDGDWIPAFAGMTAIKWRVF
jgi:hypothetical protein